MPHAIRRPGIDHFWALGTALLTYLLLLLGGLVHSTGSSLACPDWPTCYGSFNPPMEGGILYEHGHRLLGTAVGVATLVLAGLLWRRGGTLARVGLAAVAMVIVQGVLGGVTVLLELSPLVSSTHLGLSMIFFATLIWVALRTLPAQSWAPVGIGAQRWAVGAAAVVYVQLVLGALVRHSGAALACVDVPLCGGEVMPWAAPWLQTIHMSHRWFGIVAGAVVIAAAIRVGRNLRVAPLPRLLAIGAGLLVLLQVGVGYTVVIKMRAIDIVMLHFGIGAALWGMLVALVLLLRRPAPRT